MIDVNQTDEHGLIEICACNRSDMNEKKEKHEHVVVVMIELPVVKGKRDFNKSKNE